eukprot:1795706-Alexandrium_andersonii.AAC.1
MELRQGCPRNLSHAFRCDLERLALQLARARQSSKTRSLQAWSSSRVVRGRPAFSSAEARG